MGSEMCIRDRLVTTTQLQTSLTLLSVFEGCDGCTYPDASNYDETAVADNGTCEFDIANPCPADLNGDGSITTGDLLIFLGAFGTICE